METSEFLRTVITGDSGYFCLALRSQGTHGWTEEWYHWPEDLDRILARIDQRKVDHDVYFSTYLFSAASSLKEHVLPTRTIQADLDEASPTELPVVPTILVQSSPGRHQAYWVLGSVDGASSEPLDLETHELLSKRLTYAIPRCDRSGWPLGRKVRVPNTNNFKYLDGAKDVKVIGASGRYYQPGVFELLPDIQQTASEAYDSGFLESRETPILGPQELLLRYKDKIGKCYIQYNVKQNDRSAALWALTCALFRAGAPREDVFHLAKHSANNKFDELRHNADRELAKDILRAEQLIRSATRDPRAMIKQARRATGPVAERRAAIFDLVLSAMQEQGDFTNLYGGTAYYIRRDSGRPIPITRHSDYLDMLLDLQYGLNPIELDTHYVVAGLCSYAGSLPQSGTLAALTHYNHAGRFMLLHTGRKDVLQITPTSVQTVSDGAYSVVFPWDTATEPFAANLKPATEYDWADFLFSHTVRNIDALENIVSSDRDDTLALLKVWTLFLMFRDLSAARPILATLGQPGSGKTTLFKKVYTLLYGRHRAIGSVTSPDDFDHAVANDPFYALDNVDTWERWLPDRLALSAAVSDIRKRKLYTDVDIITIRRQALVGVSAHNPKFGREDVADRMLIFTFRRLERFVAEEEILAAVHAHRNDIWGGIVRDIQKIMGTKMPGSEEAPQFRIEDFAKVGLWIARALNIEKNFRRGLESVKAGQRNFSLEEESLLTTALHRLVAKDAEAGTPPSDDGWRTSGQLWGVLEILSDDSPAFIKTYRNSVYLSKKLWSMMESLREEFCIEWKNDAVRAGKLWRLRLKSGTANQG